MWDQAPFKNHGTFVSTVELTAHEFVAAGIFTPSERITVVEAAARANDELRP